MSNETADNRWKLPFFTIWTGQAFSLLGSQLVGFALIWWLTVQTGSATILAAATTIQMLPDILLGPFAGALVDRWPRKWTLIAADGAVALFTALLALLFWLDIVQPWHVLAIILLRAIGNTFHRPAMTSTTATMVPRDWLPRVGGMNSTLTGILRFAAPGLGALLLVATSMQIVLALDVVTALLAIGPLFFVAIPRLAPKLAAERQSLFQDMGEAASFIWNDKGLRTLVGSAVLLGFFMIPAVMAFPPLLVTDVFGGSVADLALLQSVIGAGLILGGLLMSTWGGFKRQMDTVLLAGFGSALLATVIGLLPGNAFVIAVVAFGLWYALAALNIVPAIYQSVVPPEMLGRFTSFQWSLLTLASPISLMIAGPIADRIGVQPFYVIAGVGCFIVACIRGFVPQAHYIEDTVTAPELGAADD